MKGPDVALVPSTSWWTTTLLLATIDGRLVRHLDEPDRHGRFDRNLSALALALVDQHAGRSDPSPRTARSRQ